jgi:hypothetical protein
MFVDDGYHATELGQCPHRPGTEEWKIWQHEFMRRQSRDRGAYDAVRGTARAIGWNGRGRDAYDVADARMKALKDATPPRTEAQLRHDAVMLEIEPVPVRLDRMWITPLDPNGAPAGIFHVPASIISFSASRYADDDLVQLLTNHIQSAVKRISFSASFATNQFKGFTHPSPRPSPRQERRTRGMTIEQRRLEQALAGKPITVRSSAQNHTWKRR